MKYKFVQDDSCHWYLLPEHLWGLWDEIIQNEEEGIRECWEDDRWEKIENCRGDERPDTICFENPEELE